MNRPCNIAPVSKKVCLTVTVLQLYYLQQQIRFMRILLNDLPSPNKLQNINIVFICFSYNIH